MIEVDTVTLAGAVSVLLDLPEGLPARSSGARLAALADVDALGPVDIGRHWRVQVWLEAASHGVEEQTGSCDHVLPPLEYVPAQNMWTQQSR